MPFILYLPTFRVIQHLACRRNITVAASETLRRHTADARSDETWTLILDLAVSAPVDPSNFLEAPAAALAPYDKLIGRSAFTVRRFFADRIVAATVEHDPPRGFPFEQ
jgi:hypothetical protein